jgi:hypothetical protein
LESQHDFLIGPIERKLAAFLVAFPGSKADLEIKAIRFSSKSSESTQASRLLQ